MFVFFFFKQKTAYEMRISDWSSDVCSSDLVLHDLWQKIAAAPERPVADPVSYLFRAAENHMRDIRRAKISREKRQFDWHGMGDAPEDEIGRASCRERVCQYV